MEHKSPKGTIKYDGTNYQAWMVMLELELRSAKLGKVMNNEASNEEHDKALAIMGRMLTAEKIILLKDCTNVQDALTKIREDQAQNIPIVQTMLLQKITNMEFPGSGKMKEYLDKMEDLVLRYRLSGGIYDDKMFIFQLISKLPAAYRPATFQIEATDTIEHVKKRLMASDCIIAMDGPNLEVNMTQSIAEKDKRIAELEAQMAAMKLESSGKRPATMMRGSFSGECFNCGRKGHRAAECRTHVNKLNCKCVKCANKPASQYPVPIIANVITNNLAGNVVLDSGATDHFCDGNTQLDEFQPTSHLRVSMANGQYSYVKGQGSYFNKDLGLKLKDVKAVSSLKQGLISVAKLADCGYRVTFDKTGASITSGNKVISRVPRVGNLYVLCGGSPTIASSADHVRVMTTKLSPTTWHQRLGHTGADKMKLLSDRIPGIGTLSGHCGSCKQGKLKQGPFHRSDSRASRPLELVHLDLAGPHPVNGFDGSRYFAVFIDDYSRHVVVYCLKDRTQVLQAFKLYRQQVESQVLGDYRVKQLQTDQARELMSGEFDDYLIDQQIRHRYSTPHSHQQNGIVERAIQSIRNIARTNRICANAPESFWPEAVRIAAHQYNVVPHSTDPKSTPHERMFGKLADYDRLRPFGALVYFYKHPVQRETASKWQPTGTAGAFLGYQENMKAYRVWDPTTRTVVKTCNVDVIESEKFWEVQSRPIPAVEESVEELNMEETDEEEHVLDDQSDEEGSSHEPVDESPSPPPQQQPLRRNPPRNRQPPSRLEMDPTKKSYVPTSEANLIAGDHDSDALKNKFVGELFLGMAASGVKVPQNYTEAMASPEREHWHEAMMDELQSLRGNGVYEEVAHADVNSGRRPLTTKWVFSLKINPDDNTIDRFKARIVIRGFEQLEGIDFDKIFAPTVSHATVRSFLTHSAVNNMKVHHVDVKTAFLHSDIDRELYCEPPEGLRTGDLTWKLRKSLYGLRQAPHCWHQKLCQVMEEDGFVQGKVDQCVFVRKTEEGETYVLVYVDDLLVASTTDELTDRFKKTLMTKVKIRDLGPVKQFIGLQVNYLRDKQCYTLSQEKLISDYFEEFDLSSRKSIRRLPEVEHMRPGIEWLSPSDQRKFRQLIGGMLYITNLTRPDVCFTVNFLSRYMQKATKVHLQNAEKALMYMYQTKERKLHLGKLDDGLLECYSDASFRRDEKDQTGIMITYHGSIVHWISRKQDNYNQSTTEAEYCALQLAADECLWLRQLLMDWNVKISSPTVIHEDNKQVINLVQNGQVATRAKYLAVKLRAIHDLIKRGFIDVQFIASRKQWADLLTKSQLPPDVDELFSGISLHAVRNRGECENGDSSLRAQALRTGWQYGCVSSSRPYQEHTGEHTGYSCSGRPCDQAVPAPRGPSSSRLGLRPIDHSQAADHLLAAY